MTFTIATRDASGKLDGGTVTVSPWFTRPSQIPEDIPGINITTGSPRLAESESLERVVDHVEGWSGWHFRGVTLPCCRSTVRAMLRSDPNIYSQVEAAINAATVSGVL